MNQITLEPMTKKDYLGYKIDNVKRYALEGVKSGRWEAEESLKESEKSIKEYLPRGMRTKNNFFFNIAARSTGDKVGVIWLAIQGKTRSKSVFVFDILIFDEYRGKGFGTDAMKEIEVWAKKMGADAIWLHAFWHNQRAIGLYKRLGFIESGVTMTKKLEVV